MKDIKPLPLKGKPLEHYGLIETEWYAERVAPDPRPLTDETLEELGFEYIPVIAVHLHNGSSYKHPEFKGLFFIPSSGNGVVGVAQFIPTGKRYTTVGSVRMLIEALKGDE